jgi:phage FluMu protein Com
MKVTPMSNETFRCQQCDKKLFEGNLGLLVAKKHSEPGEDLFIEVLCHRCKHLNRFTYDPTKYVAKLDNS